MIFISYRNEVALVILIWFNQARRLFFAIMNQCGRTKKGPVMTRIRGIALAAALSAIAPTVIDST